MYLPNPGIEPRPPTLQVDSLSAEPPGKPKQTGVGSLFLLQRIFLTQESNWGLLHCRWILYQLSYRGSPHYYSVGLNANGQLWRLQYLMYPDSSSLAYLCALDFSSVTQSSPTLCDPIDCSTPCLPIHNQLLEFTQTHVHWVGDTIQPSHPLSPLSPPAFNLSQHRGLFKWVSSSQQVAKNDCNIQTGSCNILNLTLELSFCIGFSECCGETHPREE